MSDKFIYPTIFPFQLSPCVERKDIIFAMDKIQPHKKKEKVPVVDFTRRKLIQHQMYSLPTLWTKNHHLLLEEKSVPPGDYVVFEGHLRSLATPLIAVDLRSDTDKAKYEALSHDHPPWNSSGPFTCNHFRWFRKEYSPAMPIHYPHIQGLVIKHGYLTVFRPEQDIVITDVKMYELYPNGQCRQTYDNNIRNHVLAKLAERGNMQVW